MTIILDLPEELEREMEQAAARAGLSIAEYALLVLKKSHSIPKVAPRNTGAELLAYWEQKGVLGSRPDIDDPVTFARALREQNQNRRHD